jgi:hypothetical protein
LLGRLHGGEVKEEDNEPAVLIFAEEVCPGGRRSGVRVKSFGRRWRFNGIGQSYGRHEAGLEFLEIHSLQFLEFIVLIDLEIVFGEVFYGLTVFIQDGYVYRNDVGFDAKAGVAALRECGLNQQEKSEKG